MLFARKNHTNPDINLDIALGRSAQNYSLLECFNFKKVLQNRFETLEYFKDVRKEVVVMV